MENNTKKIRPKAMIYPRLSCTIHYDEDKTVSLKKTFITKSIYHNTMKSLIDKINELRDRIRYVELKANDRDCVILQYDYAEQSDLDDMIEMLWIQFDEVYELRPELT